ncbi:DNA/RNA nuclease SfsA [Halanaerobacter jeridensis]|uniref:Sugar fermentation stimulation protein homolog n=1 Tax=Halanaerobacter jeridensis TaxID=706427 RepID=A0A938XRJ2_9FIRM|nr:DNA/RNA nuclease SfsA [Halanaerobacter jeridensis]MBM7555484.1 sugar fermentation stimulation protein A [Halanaerobacter jeridensis]
MARVEFENLEQGELIERENRFVAQVKLDDKKIKAYVPNPGRMEELMVPGTEVYVYHVPQKDRKTKYNLSLINYNNRLVSINSQLPNQLILNALEKQELQPYSQYTNIKAEHSYGNSRLDFYLQGQDEVLIEVKSVTLVEDKVAKFSDAPTERGRRHLSELIQAKKEGYRTGVIFLIQRDDANKFIPHRRIDLQFADKLKEAQEAGVEIYAWNCQVNLEGIELEEEINVEV